MKSFFKGIGVFIGMIILVAILADDEDEARVSKKETRPILTETKAYYLAQGFVKDRLKAPATADFPYSFKRKRVNDSTFIINSYVDSQNSFGALIRTNWSCIILYSPKTDLAECYKLTLNN